MKVFGIIVLYLLIGIVDFFGFFYVMCLKEELFESDSFKKALKQSLIDTCREFQTLELADSSDIAMTIVIIGGWPIILGSGVIIVPCMLCVYGIKRIAKAILDKMTKSETKNNSTGTMTTAENKTVEKSKKTSCSKPPKNTRSVRDPNYDPGKVTLKTSEVDSPSRKRIKKVKKVNKE